MTRGTERLTHYAMSGRAFRPSDGLYQIDLYDTDLRYPAACRNLTRHYFAATSACFIFSGTAEEFNSFTSDVVWEILHREDMSKKEQDNE